MDATVDLHLHSNASDGAEEPEQLLKEALAAGLKMISITDHESIEGLKKVKDFAETNGLVLIPGVELLTYFQGREIHLLGYWFDAADQDLNSWIRELREKRNENCLMTVEKMRMHGYNLEPSLFIDIADKGVTLGKNHIIYSLIQAGYVSTKEEVIDILRRYLAQNGLAHVLFDTNPFFEAVSLIREFEGIPVLAHPGLIGDDKLVAELIATKEVGLEVYYYYFGPYRERWIANYERMALEKGLFVTGGSDYHGRFSPDVKLGKVLMPEDVRERLLEVQNRKGNRPETREVTS